MESRRFSDSCLISKPSLNPAMSCGGELRKAGYLTAFSVKIFRREPVLESNLDRRPFAIEDREPRCITAAPLWTLACRQTPSNLKPSRVAADRDLALSELHCQA